MDAFSKNTDNLQLVWDASSLKSVQFCPRHYQYANLQGWQNPSMDLAFGRYFASGTERYQKMRLDGKSRQEAQIEVVKWVMLETWFSDTSQWGGTFETMWKCEGVEPYRNSKGNRAKCPFAHKRSWFPGDAPNICGECGSQILTERLYIPQDEKKNRQSLVRALVWYIEEQPEDFHSGLHPYMFPDGTHAVELSGKLPLPLYTAGGEQFTLSWNFDYIGVFGDDKYIVDNKTTTKPLDDKFFSSYSPDTQFDTYDVVGSVAYPTIGISGTLVDAISVTVGGATFGRRPYEKNEEQREEHFNDLLWWIRQAEEMALKGYWPMNKRSCWLCPFKKVCDQPPSLRQGYLKAHFVQAERWNPARER